MTTTTWFVLVEADTDDPVRTYHVTVGFSDTADTPDDPEPWITSALLAITYEHASRFGHERTLEAIEIALHETSEPVSETPDTH